MKNQIEAIVLFFNLKQLGLNTIEHFLLIWNRFFDFGYKWNETVYNWTPNRLIESDESKLNVHSQLQKWS